MRLEEVAFTISEEKLLEWEEQGKNIEARPVEDLLDEVDLMLEEMEKEQDEILTERLS